MPADLCGSGPMAAQVLCGAVAHMVVLKHAMAQPSPSSVAVIIQRLGSDAGQAIDQDKAEDRDYLVETGLWVEMIGPEQEFMTVPMTQVSLSQLKNALAKEARLREVSELEKARSAAERWHWRSRAREIAERGYFETDGVRHGPGQPLGSDPHGHVAGAYSEIRSFRGYWNPRTRAARGYSWGVRVGSWSKRRSPVARPRWMRPQEKSSSLLTA